jgi:homotetrameric cytidine deaminase
MTPSDFSNQLSAQTAQLLFTAAEEAAQHAYAPYSHFAVGASVLVASGEIITGANVENASYGLTVCAERNALARAVLQHGPKSAVAMAIMAPSQPHGAVLPCGACLQVMQELMVGTAVVLVYDKITGNQTRFPLQQLFPFPFVAP